MLNKLRSGRGASITFALLLFLVCAVLSSLIITAASSASGRIAGMAKADQRYYSVTSTCELLKSLFDGKMVTIVQVKSKSEDETEPTTHRYIVPDMDGGEAEVRYKDNTSYCIDDDEVNSSVIKRSVLAGAAFKYYKGNSSENTIQAESSYKDGSPDIIVPDIKETVGSNGDVTIIVSKETGGNPFAMKIEFTANIDDETSNKTEDGTSYEIRTTTLKWSLKDMKVISATGAGA